MQSNMHYPCSNVGPLRRAALCAAGTSLCRHGLFVCDATGSGPECCSNEGRLCRDTYKAKLANCVDIAVTMLRAV